MRVINVTLEICCHLIYSSISITNTNEERVHFSFLLSLDHFLLNLLCKVCSFINNPTTPANPASTTTTTHTPPKLSI
jgi:hypothetical protein